MGASDQRGKGSAATAGLAGAFAFLDGLTVPAFVTDAVGEVEHVNAAWREYTGTDAASLGPEGLLACIPAEDHAAAARLLEKGISRRRPADAEFEIRGANGSLRWFSCVASPRFAGGEFAGLLGICTESTERRQREEQLAFMATHDSLTGLPNRRVFESSLERSVQRARRGTVSSLLVLDVDFFKSYNDAFGHLEGDQALINFSLLLQRHVRAGDLLARIGGDEFAVLLEDTSVDEALEIAERMRHAAHAEEFVAHARAHELGFSGGLVAVDGTLDSRAVFDVADAVMYDAKEGGRNTVIAVTDSEVVTERPDRLASRLRDAINHRRFVLYYQPVLDLAGGSVAYYESLVRMTDDAGSNMPPGEFLPTVERLGLMPRLTRIVVGMALSALARHPRASISINLSGGDIADESLPRFVEEEMRRMAIDPSHLVFEMSEDAVMGNLGSVRTWMDRLGRLGCRFVLDDFGAGLGLFGLLRDMPFHQVKLDGSIVTALSNNGESAAFVEAVRALIESQGRTAVAAWVESADLLDRVTKAGFVLGQGYHLEFPTPDLEGLVQRYG